MPIPPPEFLHFVESYIPFNKFLGMKLEEMTDGFCRLLLPFRDEFVGDVMRPALHGGVISTLIDTAGGLAAWTQLTLEDRVSTIDLRVDYLAPAALESLYAEARVVRVGNRVAVVDVRCFQPSKRERTVATGKGVYNVKRKEDAP